jgi:hypothetical protein
MFPTTGGPTPDQEAMEEFKHRHQVARNEQNKDTFIGAFPNFFYATRDGAEFGGTIFIKHTAAEFRDLQLANLPGNTSLADFVQRMKATHMFARELNQGFIGAFPNFFHADHGQGLVCGTILIREDAAVFRDVPLADLKNPPLDNIAERFKATQVYATEQGFLGGFPNFFVADQGQGIVCGTILLPHTSCVKDDVFLFKLH